jgi:hypothetical protein
MAEQRQIATYMVVAFLLAVGGQLIPGAVSGRFEEEACSATGMRLSRGST